MQNSKALDDYYIAQWNRWKTISARHFSLIATIELFRDQWLPFVIQKGEAPQLNSMILPPFVRCLIVGLTNLDIHQFYTVLSNFANDNSQLTEHSALKTVQFKWGNLTCKMLGSRLGSRNVAWMLNYSKMCIVVVIQAQNRALISENIAEWSDLFTSWADLKSVIHVALNALMVKKHIAQKFRLRSSCFHIYLTNVRLRSAAINRKMFSFKWREREKPTHSICRNMNNPQTKIAEIG